MSIKIFSGDIKITETSGKVSSYEKFIITFNPDGTKILKTISISPNGDLLRDVNQYFSNDWKDIEGMARLFYKKKYLGTIFRRIVNRRLHSTIWKTDGTIDKASFDAPENMHLGFHPVTHDSWKMNFLKTSHNNKQDIFVHTISSTWNGSTLTHGQKLYSSATFEGKETVKLSFGNCDCEKFLWRTPSDKLLAIWRTGEARVLAKMEVLIGRNKGAIYELEKYNTEHII